MTETQPYAQIAYGISPMVLAATEAWLISHKPSYADISLSMAAWYYGANNAEATMYDVHTGRGFDGINGKTQVNINAGAESTIESLLAMQAIEQLTVEKTKYAHFLKDRVFKKIKSSKQH
jgi:hypothetical protein